jgi:hypothetical protein
VADFDSSSVEYSGSVTRDLVLVMVEKPGGQVWRGVYYCTAIKLKILFLTVLDYRFRMS